MNTEIDKPKAGRRLAQGARLFTAVAVLLIGGEELFSRWTNIQYLEVFLEKRATLEILAWGALVAGSLGAILGLILLVRFGKARLVWGATGLLAMIVSGTVVVISYGAIPPRFTEAELNSWAEGDKLVIEEITGRHYERPVTIRIGSREELLVLMEPWFRLSREETLSGFGGGTTFAYLGHYEPKEHLVRLFPAAFAFTKKSWGLSGSACRSMVRRTLLTELVHALDDQHGFIRPREDVEKKRQSAPQDFFVIRALEEGHAEWVAGRVFEKLDLSPQVSVRSGICEKYTLAGMMGGVFYFIYVEGKNFMAALFRAGGTALVEKTILNPPPWLHYVRYPDIYFADLESGELTIYQKLADVLEKVPEEGQWKLTMGPAGPDIQLMQGPWDTVSSEEVELEEHKIARWLAIYSEQTAQRRRLSVLLRRSRMMSIIGYWERGKRCSLCIGVR